MEYWWNRQKEIKTFSNSLENLTAFFGEAEGLRRFEENRQVSSKRNKGFNVRRRWANKGLSEEEMEQKEKEIASRRIKTRLENNGGVYTDKSKLPWCREYYLGSNLTEEEIEAIRTSTFRGFHTLDEEAKREIARKRTETRKKNGKPLCGGVSKQSVRFFEELVQEFPELHNSLFGKNQERWLRDPDNFDKYYFFDLTNLERKIIIEYDGWEWHPRTREGEWGSFMKPYQAKQYDNDRRKEYVAKHYGFDIIRYRTDFSEEEKSNFYKTLRKLLND